jgi:CubicO group peptidase (beta-lactamase class C family)
MGVLLMAVLLSPGAALAAMPPQTAASAQEFDAFANKTMETFGTPGMAVARVESDKISTFAYGVRRLGAPPRVDAHTIFPIGSNTKAFTAAALAILVDQGKLRWDDRVVDRLPGFRMYDAYASSEMTIIDLLCHRSGLGLGEGDLLFIPSTNRSRADVVHAIRYLKPATSFRSGYAYDNVLYSVAGEVVEAVSGERWEDFVRHHLLQPLGMRDAVVDINAQGADSVARHGRVSSAVRGIGPQSVLTTVMSGDAVAPAGAINASADDMGRWLRVQLKHGALDDGKRLFSEAASQQMWTPRTLMPIGAAAGPLGVVQPSFQAYALGFVVRDYRGHKIIFHTGGVLGGISVVAFIPEKNAAFAVLVNSEDVGTLMAMFYHLLDQSLDLPPSDWIGTFKQVFEQQQTEALKVMQAQQGASHPERGPSLQTSAYAGVYRDAWYGTATISRSGNGLDIRMDRTPGMQGALQHVQYDTFRTHWGRQGIEDAYVTFALDPDGSIREMSMKPVSPLADFSYDYQDLLFKPVAAKAAASP